MRLSKMMPAEEAIRFVRWGATLAVGRAEDVQEPDLLIRSLLERNLREGELRDLTEFNPIRNVELQGRGTSAFGERGLLHRMTGGSRRPFDETNIVERGALRETRLDETLAIGFASRLSSQALELSRNDTGGVLRQRRGTDAGKGVKN